MANNVGIDIFSSVPLYVEPKANGNKLSEATGFLWLKDGQHWLLTNWHVLSGRNPENGQCLHSMGGIPDCLTVFFPRLDLLLEPIELDVQLIDDETTLWIEHPRCGKYVDIAAIKISPPDMTVANYFPINEVPEMNIVQRIGMAIFILGFPFGIRQHKLAVWKAGTFASEPFFSSTSDTYLLVDSASRPGMSGAPVIQRQYGDIELEDGRNGRTANRMGGARLVGMYAGRFQTNDPNDAQLGRVWPIRLVREMMESA